MQSSTFFVACVFSQPKEKVSLSCRPKKHWSCGWRPPGGFVSSECPGLRVNNGSCYWECAFLRIKNSRTIDGIVLSSHIHGRSWKSCEIWEFRVLVVITTKTLKDLSKNQENSQISQPFQLQMALTFLKIEIFAQGFFADSSLLPYYRFIAK